tara:strand:- start:2690 stop:2959 length:270 start_codon:yes stop_codon:yes gene_type:complete
MSEFTIDIDKALENAKNSSGLSVQEYPDGVTSVFRSVVNCENLAGLDRDLMAKLVKGNYTEYNTIDHSGRQSKKIVIEYDITHKKDDDT